jgi:predicted transcriptional regulator of viral defense system
VGEAVARVGGAVARLAARQHGVVAARQLRALGVGQDAIEYRLAIGELHRVHAGVYAVGHRRLSDHGRWMAAVLAGGEGATLSHRPAAALAGFRDTLAQTIDVTVPRHRGRRQGIGYHQARLHPADRTTIDGIAVTSVPRTLLDLASQLAPNQLDRAFWEAERLALIDPPQLRSLMARSHGARGVRRLRALAGRLLPPEVTTRSVLERRFFELCREEGLPLPALNERVHGFEVDALWPEQRLIVELDGRAYHRGADAFETDRIRDATLQLAGYRVIRLTDRTLDRATGMLRKLLA